MHLQRHRNNYSDLPLWDMIFGTFINPGDVETLPVGFYTGASARIPEMLIGKDVSKPKLIVTHNTETNGPYSPVPGSEIS